MIYLIYIISIIEFNNFNNFLFLYFIFLILIKKKGYIMVRFFLYILFFIIGGKGINYKKKIIKIHLWEKIKIYQISIHYI